VRPGFPVLLQAPEYVASVDAGTDRVHLNQTVPYGTKIVSSPAVADLLGDGHKEIVVGRNEEYNASQDGGLNASPDTYNPAFAALGQSGVIHSGNGRVYAVFSDGACHGMSTCTTSSGLHTNAYVPGWPVKVVKFDEELLPYVGSGVDTPPALLPGKDLPCPADGTAPAAGDRVGVFTSDGPPYIFAGDGKSCYGQAGGHDRVLGTAQESGNSTDTPYLEAVGNAAFGDLTGTGDVVLAAPTAGIVRALDAILSEHQYNAQDAISAWSLLNLVGPTAPGTPQPHAGFPHFTNDLQFLTGPAIADISGTGLQEVIAGSATSDLRAVTPAGVELAGWSKNTGGWTVATPAVGPMGTDPHQMVASLTREGTLFLWQTTAPACSGASWPRYKHDMWNTGNFGVDATTPSTITDLKVSQSGSTVTLTFTAPHASLFCGNAAGYEIRYSQSGPITDATWAQATLAGPTGTACRYQPQPASPAGSSETITLTGCPGNLYFDVQAYNAASRSGGDLGAISLNFGATAVPEVAAPLLLVPAALLAGIVGPKLRRRRPGVGPLR
jgi:hypothetical protein